MRRQLRRGEELKVTNQMVADTGIGHRKVIYAFIQSILSLQRLKA